MSVQNPDARRLLEDRAAGLRAEAAYLCRSGQLDPGSEPGRLAAAYRIAADELLNAAAQLPDSGIAGLRPRRRHRITVTVEADDLDLLTGRLVAAATNVRLEGREQRAAATSGPRSDYGFVLICDREQTPARYAEQLAAWRATLVDAVLTS